jgi:hypothetical protein
MDRKFLWGLVAGVGACAVAPVLRPVADELLRPVLKAAVRGGFTGVERGRVAWARVTEELEDVLAEVRAEREQALTEELAEHHQAEETREAN